MKHLLLFPAIAMAALVTLNSCTPEEEAGMRVTTKEEQSATDLLNQLSDVLDKVTDYKSAEAAAPKARELATKINRAKTTYAALNKTALARSYDSDNKGGETDAYVDATKRLVKEVGRVRSGIPTLVTDRNAVNDEELIVALGYGEENNNFNASRDEIRAAGLKYLQNDADDTRDDKTPAFMGSYYRSPRMTEALDILAQDILTRSDENSDKEGEPVGGPSTLGAPAAAATVDKPAETADKEADAPADEAPATDADKDSEEPSFDA